MTDLIANESGRLRIEEADAAELAERYGTPLYVVSEQSVRANYRDIHRAFSSRYPDVCIAFAVKAYNHVAICSILASEGSAAECFGLGEMEICARAGIPSKSTWLNGSNKTDAEILHALRGEVRINIDNPEEFARVSSLAEQHGLTARALLRIKLPLGGLEHRTVTDYRYDPPVVNVSDWAAGHKFGMTLTEAIDCCRAARQRPLMDLVGIHHHLKGQTPHEDDFRLAALDATESIGTLKEETGWVPKEVDLGGGLAFGHEDGYGPAARDRAVPSVDDYAEAITGGLKQGCREASIPLPRLVIEPGRAMVANSTVLLTRVGTVKEHPGRRPWLHVDASINHVIRSYTGNWYYRIIAADQPTDAAAVEHYDVVGSLCDAADIIGRDRTLPVAHRGDLLAILDVGAYAESAASNFNTQCRPGTVLVSGSASEVVTERESVPDLLRNQRLASWLDDSAGNGPSDPSKGD